ncbi:hypothetical protein TRVL_08470 [Trypanosoma vivax]|nr:hypothetical protein TRVL_08470 [Trypanosoma vivax]
MPGALRRCSLACQKLVSRCGAACQSGGDSRLLSIECWTETRPRLTCEGCLRWRWRWLLSGTVVSVCAWPCGGVLVSFPSCPFQWSHAGSSAGPAGCCGGTTATGRLESDEAWGPLFALCHHSAGRRALQCMLRPRDVATLRGPSGVGASICAAPLCLVSPGAFARAATSACTCPSAGGLNSRGVLIRPAVPCGAFLHPPVA